MDLQFHGDWPVWQGFGLAVILATVCWLLYRRELRGRHDVISTILPWLRSVVVFLVAAMLTQPVWHHRHRVGELAHVKLVVDATRSMSLRDTGMDSGRKLLLARRLGLITEDPPRLQSLQAAEQLAAARAASAKALESQEPAALTKAAQELAAALTATAKTWQPSDPAIAMSMIKPGAVTWECWRDIPGSDLQGLRRSDRFPGQPSDQTSINRLQAPENYADNFGARIRGYLLPRETGAYQLDIMSDDRSELWLSATDDTQQLQRVAFVREYVGPGEWERYPEQRSSKIQLAAGRSYYFEALHKDGQGGDFLAVGWRLPGGNIERPIPGDALGTYVKEEAPNWEQLAAKLREPATDARALATTLLDAQSPCGTLESAARRIFTEAAAKHIETDAAAAAAIRELDELRRWQRIQQLMLDGTPSLLTRLAAQHDVELLALGDEGLTTIWSSRAGRFSRAAPAPAVFDFVPDAHATDLSRALEADAAVNRGATPVPSDQSPTAIVLISDGRHNGGESPVYLSKVLGSRGIKLYDVGIGALETADDLAVVEIEAPTSIYYKDRVAGRVRLMDGATAGQTFRLQALCDGKVLWETSRTTDGLGARWVSYEFSIEEHVTSLGQADAAGVERHNRPVNLTFAITDLAHDEEPRNNQRDAHLQALLQKRKLLIVEGRPRWEWRYVHNLFERDERWEVHSVLANAAGLPRGDGPGLLPQTREGFFAYDLIIFGEIPPALLRPEEHEWIRDSIGDRGAGLVLLDGQRRALRGYADIAAMQPLLPVRWTDAADLDHELDRLQLTARGRALPAFNLATATNAASPAWSELPKIHWAAAARPQPGAEVLVEGVRGAQTNAICVSQHFGSGNVLYLATDDLWRWRVDATLEQHERFWQQIAEWIMEAPFAVQDDRVSLDAGPAQYAPGQKAKLRARIRDERHQPLLQAKAWAVVTRNGNPVSELPLTPDEGAGGLYRAETAALEPGEYEMSVRLEGQAETTGHVSTRFSVATQEGDELTELTCNAALLREMATHAQGAYLPEERIDELESLLKPFSQGRVVETSTVLWQSYPWFCLVAALLTLEWILRRRAGLL